MPELKSQVLGRQSVSCSAVEIVRINPPVGQSCGQYMATFISFAGGYLLNPEALTDCEFCGTQSSDQFLGSSFNIFYVHRWRDIGALVGFIGFNVSCVSSVAPLVLTGPHTDHCDICFHLSFPHSHWKLPPILKMDKSKEGPKQSR